MRPSSQAKLRVAPPGRDPMPPCSRGRVWMLATLAVLLLSSAACAAAAPPRGAPVNGPLVRSVNLNDPVRPVPQEGAVTLSAAKNEWASFAIQLDRLPRPNAKRTHALRLRSLRLEGTNETIAVEQFSAFQVIELPVDVNRAGYVRHTGLSVENRNLPRAMLPVKHEKGLI